MRGTKSANSALFIPISPDSHREDWHEAEMKKNKSDGGIYFVIVTKSMTSPRSGNVIDLKKEVE